MNRTYIKDIYKIPDSFENKTITAAGWTRSIRSSNAFGFIELNDGSYFKNLQVVFESNNIDNYDDIASQNVGASLTVTGKLVLTPESKQPFELKAEKIEVEGTSTPDYPLQKKRHSVEFLRTIAHLRPRTNLFSAVFRVRSAAAYAIHKFFNDNNFVYIHTPIITTSDCEGAGEMFRVTTIDFDNAKKLENGKIDYSEDFFGKEAFLTVSGQINVECFAMTYGNVYTFGPTFRAEVSNTSRHAAEFWMIEPEMAFADLNDDMEVAEKCIVYVTSYVLENCREELEFLNSFVDNGLLERLDKLVNSEFKHLTYTEAVAMLEKAEQKFEFPVKWGMDIQSEHERYICEKIFNGPVFVTDYPKEIKSFYMRQNDDGKTVAAADMLVPGIGELVGGSQREERYNKLLEAIERNGLNEKDYWWYIELRKYGGVKHSGFGIGFERLIMYLTGVTNIRDVCAFPRTSGAAEF